MELTPFWYEPPRTYLLGDTIYTIPLSSLGNDCLLSLCKDFSLYLPTSTWHLLASHWCVCMGGGGGVSHECMLLRMNMCALVQEGRDYLSQCWLELTIIRVAWMASRTQGSTCHSGLKSACRLAWFFWWGLELEVGSSCLCGHLPSSWLLV